MLISSQKSRLLEVLSVAILWGLVAVSIKLVDGNPINIGLVRLAIGLPFFLFIPKLISRLKKLQKKDLGALSILGLLFFLHWSTYFYSIKLAGPNIAILGLCTYGVHLMVLSAIFLGTKPKATDIVALFLALTGVCLISPELSFSSDKFLGLLMGIFGGFFFAALPIVHKKYSHLDDSVRAFSMMALALLFFSLSSLAAPWQANVIIDWKLFLFLGVFGTFVSHTLWTSLSTKLSTNITSVVYYLNAPSAIFWSYIILEIAPLWNELAGGALIVIGGIVAVLNLAKR